MNDGSLRWAPALPANRTGRVQTGQLIFQIISNADTSLLVLILGLVIVKYLRTINIVNTTFGTFENVFSLLDFFKFRRFFGEQNTLRQPTSSKNGVKRHNIL